jgi:hypothetical protein
MATLFAEFADQEKLIQQAKLTSVIDEVLQDTDQYVSLVEVLSEIVSRKLPEEPEVLVF